MTKLDPLDPGTAVRVAQGSWGPLGGLDCLSLVGQRGEVEAYGGWRLRWGGSASPKVERSRLGEGWVGPDGPFYATPEEAYALAQTWSYPPDLTVHFYAVRFPEAGSRLVAAVDLVLVKMGQTSR